jgi:hypothetical protein
MGLGGCPATLATFLIVKPRLASSSSLGLDTHLLEDIIDPLARGSMEGILPSTILDTLLLGEDAPVRRVLRLEPLEVIDLVPLVGRLILLLGKLGIPLAPSGVGALGAADLHSRGARARISCPCNSR